MSSRQVEIMTSLGMDQGLIGVKGSRASLETTWKRYTAITKAISLVNDVDWESGKKPVDSEIIGVYGGKSAFYDQLKVLQHVRNHPEMVEWLERSDYDYDEDNNLWGYYKPTYMLKDLENWLVRKHKQGKGKGKETGQPQKQKGKGKGKAKKVDDDDNDSGSPPPKRAHKKSVGGRK